MSRTLLSLAGFQVILIGRFCVIAEEMPITIHNNENLKNAAYLIEEHVFNNCKLTNCQLFYDGGPFQWANTSFENCTWGFREAARNTIQVLTTLGLLKPGQAPPQALQGTTGGQVH